MTDICFPFTKQNMSVLSSSRGPREQSSPHLNKLFLFKITCLLLSCFVIIPIIDIVMIRLTPSLITIGLCDIKDYDRRTKRRAKLQLGNTPRATPHSRQIILPIRSISSKNRVYGPSVSTIPSNDGSHLANQTNRQPDDGHNVPRLESPFALECIFQTPVPDQDSGISEWTNAAPRSSNSTITNNYSVDDSSGVVELSERYNDARKETFEEWLDARRAKITDEIQEAQSSQESAELEMGEESFENFSARRFSSPSKDNFDYGGFVESPSQQESDQSRGSSPFGKAVRCTILGITTQDFWGLLSFEARERLRWSKIINVS